LREAVRRTFAVGRVLFVAAPGVAQAHPWFRWDGLLGRRRHSSMTIWARPAPVGAVRIGVGAWRTCQGTHTARRHWPASLTSLSLRCHPSTLRRKETGPLAESVVNSHPWRVQTWHAGGYRPPAPPESSAVPLARHPEAFRRKVKKRYARPNAQSKNLTEQSSPRLTTLIGVQRSR